MNDEGERGCDDDLGPDTNAHRDVRGGTGAAVQLAHPEGTKPADRADTTDKQGAGMNAS